MQIMQASLQIVTVHAMKLLFRLIFSTTWTSVIWNVFALFTFLTWNEKLTLSMSVLKLRSNTCVLFKEDLSYVLSSCVGLRLAFIVPWGFWHDNNTHAYLYNALFFLSPLLQLTTAEYVCSWVRMTTLMPA